MRPCSGGLFARLIIVLLLQIGAAAMPAGAQTTDLAGLMRQITDLTKAGKVTEAISLGRKLVTEAEKLAGKEHPLTATTLFTLARLHILQGQLDEAEAILKRALTIREKALGPDHAEVADTLASLADVAIARGRYPGAERSLQRALAIRERTLGAEHYDTAMTLVAIGRIRHAEARYGEAEALFARALAVLRKSLGPEHMLVATTLNNLAVVSKEQGHLVLAETRLREALAIQQKQLGPDSIAVAVMLNNLGELHVRQGKYAEAEVLHRREVQITEKALGPNHPSVATSLNNLASLISRQGRAAEAEGLLRRALAIQEKSLGDDHPDIATMQTNLADVIRVLRRPAEAEALLRRSITIQEKRFGSEHASVAITLDSLAALFYEQDRFLEAEPIARRALAIREKAFNPAHPLVARSLNQLAVVLDSLQRHGEAEPMLRRALAINEAVLGNSHPEFAVALHNLASHHHDLRQWPDAYAAYKRASAIWVSRGSAVSGVSNEAGQNEIKSYEDPFRGLIAAAYHVAESAPGEAAVKLRAEAFESAQWASGASASAAIARMSARAAAGGGQLGELVRQRQDLAEQASATDRALIALMSQPAQQRASAADAALRQQAETIAQKLKDVGAALGVRFPQYAALVSAGPIPMSDAAGLLGPGEALLLFAPTRDDTYLWAVTRNSSRWVKIPLGMKALGEHVAALRCGLDSVGAWRGEGAQRCMELLKLATLPAEVDQRPFDLSRAHELYRALFGQIEDLIEGKHLLIVPSGPLTSIPFHVLIASPPSTAGAVEVFEDFGRADWLAKRAAISVLPSIASLKALRQFAQRSQAKAPFIGFGNPLLLGPGDADRRAWERQSCRPASARVVAGAADRHRAGPAPKLMRGGLAQVEEVRRQPPLPETADELCTVARLLGAPEGSVHLGANATERKIKGLSASGALRSARFVHFATHGLLASEAEGVAQARAEPALLLTPPQQASEEDDGLLTASEVAQLKLDADWVIMSACNTAAGDKLDAEALSGLARAFFYAGSRALLVSHWYVDSDATVALVTKAFAEMIAQPNIGRAEALRRAMLALIEAGGRAAHPANWAPFVVVGEGGS